MNTRQLECFVAVAECLNFTKAAEQLYMAQPSVSNQISTLEAEIPAQLFRRANRHVLLTGAGRAFLPYAKKVLQLTQDGAREAARVEFQDLRSMVIGHHNIANDPMFCQIIHAYTQCHPDVQISIRIAKEQDLYRAVGDGTLDLAVVFHRREMPLEPLEHADLFSGRAQFIMRDDHPLAKRKELALEDLRGETLLGNPDRHWAQGLPPLGSESMPEDLFSDQPLCGSMDDALVCAAAGQGIFVAPSRFEGLPAGLAQVPLKNSRPVWQCVLWNQKTTRPAAMEFVAYLTKANHAQREGPL